MSLSLFQMVFMINCLYYLKL